MSETPSPHRTIAERFIDGRSSADQPAVSPDGTHVAFIVATVDLAKNTTRSRIWLDDAPMSAGDHDGNPTWSPDGRFLAFTSRRGEKQGDSTLHVLPIEGPGELRTVCTMPDGLDDVALLVANAGGEPSVVVAAVLAGSGNHGFNAANDTYGDMIEMGILDPTKVTRTALQNAASIGALILTTEAIVSDKPEKAQSSQGGGDMGGMGGGGMGGMDF